jgi:hypothetical protein
VTIRADKGLECKTRYSSLAEFYPHYLAEHSDRFNRALHVIGTGGSIAFALAAAIARKPRLLLGVPIVGYGLAWIGHYFFERNKPATFKQPLYSLASDFLMLRDELRQQPRQVSQNLQQRDLPKVFD